MAGVGGDTWGRHSAPQESLLLSLIKTNKRFLNIFKGALESVMDFKAMKTTWHSHIPQIWMLSGKMLRVFVYVRERLRGRKRERGCTCRSDCILEAQLNYLVLSRDTYPPVPALSLLCTRSPPRFAPLLPGATVLIVWRQQVKALLSPASAFVWNKS